MDLTISGQSMVITVTENGSGLTLIGSQAGSLFAGTNGEPGATQVDQTIRGSTPNTNALAVQHMSNAGFAAVRMVDDAGHEHGAVGWGNSGTGAPWTSRFYIEASNPASVGTYPVFEIVQTLQGTANKVRFLGNAIGRMQFNRFDGVEQFTLPVAGGAIVTGAPSSATEIANDTANEAGKLFIVAGTNAGAMDTQASLDFFRGQTFFGNVGFNGNTGTYGGVAKAKEDLFFLTPSGGNAIKAFLDDSRAGALVLAAGMDLGGKVAHYNNIATVGEGVPAIYGATLNKAETETADASVLTYTPPAAAGLYRVTVAANVKTATSGVVGFTVAYTDSGGNAVFATVVSLTQLGVAVPDLTFTTSASSRYYGTATIAINNAAANIVVGWVGGGTVTADVSATIEQIA